jgi:hypothetical protein
MGEQNMGRPEDWQAGGQRGRQGEVLTDRQPERRTDRQTDRQIDEHAGPDWWMDSQANRQTTRQTRRHLDTYRLIVTDRQQINRLRDRIGR